MGPAMALRRVQMVVHSEKQTVPQCLEARLALIAGVSNNQERGLERLTGGLRRGGVELFDCLERRALT